MKQNQHYPNIEKCDPTTCVSGNMMKSNRIVANVFRKHLKPFNITDSQLSILFVITKAKEVNQKKISEALFMEKSTVNRNISRLVEQDIIAFGDQLYLKTTEKGKEFLERILPHWDNAMKEINEILNHDGREALAVITKKLTK